MKFALNQSKLPALIVKSDDEGQIELDFSDNLSDLVTLKIDDVPYAVTVNKIGQYYVIDSDLKEETVRLEEEKVVKTFRQQLISVAFEKAIEGIRSKMDDKLQRKYIDAKIALMNSSL